MKNFWKVWWIALAIKIVIAILLPFANDEAYYWVWGHHPHLSYFDHPGMIAWIYYLGTFIENFGNAARLPGVILAHCTLLIWSMIIAPFIGNDDRKKTLWLIFLAISPFLGIGSLIVTPDTPFLFFWSLSILLMLRALETRSVIDYALLGASLGLGFCSKYMIVLFVPCAVIWLFVSREWRAVRPIKLLLTIVTGLVFCTPVLVWNAQNDWASFAFQLQHGLKSEKYSHAWPWEYLGSQILILFPIAVYYALRRKSARGTSFLHVFGWLPLAFFFYTSFKAHVEANWPMMAHPEILALAFLNTIDDGGETPASWMRGQWIVWVAATLLIFSQVLHPWFPINPRELKTYEWVHYDVFIPVAAQHPNDLYMGSYQEAAGLSYKLRRQIYKLDGMNRHDFYDFTPQSHPKSDSFVVGVERWQGLPYWASVEGYVIAGETVISDEFKLIEVKRAKDLNR